MKPVPVEISQRIVNHPLTPKGNDHEYGNFHHRVGPWNQANHCLDAQWIQRVCRETICVPYRISIKRRQSPASVQVERYGAEVTLRSAKKRIFVGVILRANYDFVPPAALNRRSASTVGLTS